VGFTAKVNSGHADSTGVKLWHGVGRAGLNEREALGKVVTARPPERLAQLHSVSHALVTTLQKHRSKTSKLVRFGSLHYRNNWEWPWYGGSCVVNLFK